VCFPCVFWSKKLDFLKNFGQLYPITIIAPFRIRNSKIQLKHFQTEHRTSRRVNQCWAKFEFLAKKVQKTVIFDVFWPIFENFEH